MGGKVLNNHKYVQSKDPHIFYQKMFEYNEQLILPTLKNILKGNYILIARKRVFEILSELVDKKYMDQLVHQNS